MANPSFQQEFTANMSDTISAFGLHLAEANHRFQKSYIESVVELSELDNVEVHAKVNVISLDTSFDTDISAPPLIIVGPKPVVIKKAKLNMTMDVAAHTDDNFKLGAKIGAEGEAGLNVGPFAKASVKIKADVSVDKERKRSSDKRAHTDIEIEFGLDETPEGVCLIQDTIRNRFNAALIIDERRLGIVRAEDAAQPEAA